MKNDKKDEKVSRSKEAAKVKEFDRSWLRKYPWLVPIRDGKEVIGVLCGVCREAGSMYTGRRDGTGVTKPFT